MSNDDREVTTGQAVLGILTALAYVAAAIVVLLDIFVWRA